MYTLDQAQTVHPTLWTIRPGTGQMKPVPGVRTYPAKSTTEEASFQGAQSWSTARGVIFNNPESLLAVVVFTDKSHTPVIVDKSTAVVVSAAGPGDVNVKAQKHRPAPKPRPHQSGPGPTTPPTTAAQPLTQPVTPQVNCATTTEKPYEPQNPVYLPIGPVRAGGMDLPPLGRTGLPAQHLVRDRYRQRRRRPARPPRTGGERPTAAPGHRPGSGDNVPGRGHRLPEQPVHPFGACHLLDDGGRSRRSLLGQCRRQWRGWLGGFVGAPAGRLGARSPPRPGP